MRSLIAVLALVAACASNTPDPALPPVAATPSETPPPPPPPADPCATLSCTEGTACQGGACVPTSTPTVGCAVHANVRVLPSFARGASDVVVADGVAWVATALGLEAYAAGAPLGDAAPAPLGWTALDGPATAVAVDGARVAVAHGLDGVTLVEAATYAPVAHVPSGGSALGVALAGARLAVADGTGGLALWDVSDPALPVALGVAELAGPANAVVLAGDVAYVAMGSSGLAVVDVTDPATPEVVATRDTVGEAVRLTAAGGRLYVAARYGGLRLFDLADPKAPTALGAYARTDNMLIPTDVEVDPTTELAYVTDYWHPLHVVDVSDPWAPAVLGVTGGASGTASAVAVAEGHAWVAGGGIQRFDVSDAAVPTLDGGFGAPLGEEATDARAVGKLVYLAAGTRLQVIDRSTMTVVSNTKTELPALALDVAGKWAYVGLDATYPMILAGQLVAYDVSDPAAPVAHGSAKFPGRPGQVRVAGSVVYATGAWLDAFDVSDPAAPVHVWSGEPNHSTEGLDVQGDLLAVTRRYNDTQLYDISERKAPKLLGAFDSPGQAIGVALHGSVAYLADGTGGVRVVDVSNPAKPVEVGSIAMPGTAFRLAAGPERLWALVDGQVRAFDLSDPLRPAPLMTLSSAGRTPTSVSIASDGAIVVTDRKVPLVELTLSCVDTTPDATPAPTAAVPGVQWVNLLGGSTAMDVMASDAIVVPALGFAQGSEPTTAPTAEVLWKEGATTLVSSPPFADGLAIAAGTPAAPVEVRVPAAGTPASSAARLRVVNAASGLSVMQAAVTRGQERHALGAPAFGERGPAIDLVGPGGWELSLVTSQRTLLLPLPTLAPGHATDAIVALSKDGEVFVLLQRDDGETRQAGATDYATRWRLVDLTGAALTGLLEGEPDIDVEALSASDVVSVWPGTKHIDLAGATTYGTIEALPLEKGGQSTTYVYETGSGSLASATLEDINQTQDSSKTAFQVLHAAKDLGTVDLYLLAMEDYYDTNPTKSLLAKHVDLGDTTPLKLPPTGSYSLGVDTNADGTLEHVFYAGYFTNYGTNMFLSRDAEGRLRLGHLTPASEPIWWTYSEEQLCKVRVVNLTKRSDIVVDIPLWYEASKQSLGSHTSTSTYQVLSGELTFDLGTWEEGDQWSWTGTLLPKHRYSIVLWEKGDGSIAVKRIEDEGTAGVRVVHLAPDMGTVSASWTPEDGGTPVALGDVAPGGLSAIASEGVAYATPGTVRIDQDLDGTPDLTFDLENGAMDVTTNVYLVEDATWPYVLVHGADGYIGAAYAEELQSRLRVVYLPQGSAVLKVDVDGAPLETLWSKQGWGSVEAFFGASCYSSVSKGEHTLHAVAQGIERTLDVSLAGGTRHTLLVYGPTEDPILLLLDDDVADGVTVFNGAVGTGALGVYTLADPETPPVLLAGGVAYGTSTAVLTPKAQPTAFALDRDGDGKPDWKTLNAPTSGRSWVFILGSVKAPGLLVLGDNAWPWLGGELME